MGIRRVIGAIFFLLFVAWIPQESKYQSCNDVYKDLRSKGYLLPDSLSFQVAYESYVHYSKAGKVKKKVLALADFSKSSNSKRLWVFNLEAKKLLFHTWVAHGKYSGQEFATSFSNVSGSKKTSLGAYATAETYQGGHGYSLKLDGLEKGINDNARSRAVVMHGASYVSADFIRKYGRLGRSFGCPAVSVAESKAVIDALKGGAFLFHYYPQ